MCRWILSLCPQPFSRISLRARLPERVTRFAAEGEPTAPSALAMLHLTALLLASPQRLHGNAKQHHIMAEVQARASSRHDVASVSGPRDGNPCLVDYQNVANYPIPATILKRDGCRCHAHQLSEYRMLSSTPCCIRSKLSGCCPRTISTPTLRSDDGKSTSERFTLLGMAAPVPSSPDSSLLSLSLSQPLVRSLGGYGGAGGHARSVTLAL
jgi:hypothetical protein